MAVWLELLVHILLLLLGCYLGALECQTRSGAPIRDPGRYGVQSLVEPADAHRDMVSHHMYRLYEKYNRKPNRYTEENTVRSFRACQDSSAQRTLYHLNLSSLQDSEIIISATFHFLFHRHQGPRAWFCKRYKSAACRSPKHHHAPAVHLVLRSNPSGSGFNPGLQGSLLGNVTIHADRKGSWQMKDVTAAIQAARVSGNHFVSLEWDLGLQFYNEPEEALSGLSLPYLLVYADDQALDEPNSVAQTLQRYAPDADKEAPSPPSLPTKPVSKGRLRREVLSHPDSVQNNELPEVEYRPGGSRKHDPYETPYYTLKPIKHGRKENRKRDKNRGEEEKHQESDRGSQPPVQSAEDQTQTKRSDEEGRLQDNGDGRTPGWGDSEKAGGRTSPVLSFDERTMRKARRRQWGSEHQVRGCSRRTLMVDFADIGWSEWVLAPKAFDAFYCAGSCGFPIPKVLRPSNHATIQSIVRTVGIITGIPEPCCVPEKTKPLGVLYQDTGSDLVLKVYPSMSVESCACRLTRSRPAPYRAEMDPTSAAISVGLGNPLEQSHNSPGRSGDA
ncbi:hypothetical protein DPEC_G00036380 [Dallia pectoralis]|uniref:Uncharacterized protein n=1 Tax=Dallia pectoralis TaxID=75939 RepID=A0ACC2HEH7_DALPE|nr:hypothetical protein DPEC_G00036380 [Dallia pectoralis]